MTRPPLFGTKIRIAGFGGLRLGEQGALRAIDVFFDRGYLRVNGARITPRGAPAFRGPVKNNTLHEVPPLPASFRVCSTRVFAYRFEPRSIAGAMPFQQIVQRTYVHPTVDGDLAYLAYTDYKPGEPNRNAPAFVV